VDDQIREEDVWTALATVYDPEIPVAPVIPALISSVRIDQQAERASIETTLTARGSGVGPVVLGAVADGLRLAGNVAEVKVDLVFDPPWSGGMMSEEAKLETGLFF